MDGYKKYLESTLAIYVDMEKQCTAAKITALEKLQYTMFILNTGTCTLFAKLNKASVNMEKINFDDPFISEINVLLCGAFLAVLSISIGYISKIYSTEYSLKFRKYEALKLKNISMFEDYLSGKRYCDDFSPYVASKADVKIRILLQRNLAKYEELEKANIYNYTISQNFEDVSVIYIFISFIFFCQAIGMFSFVPIQKSELLQDLYNCFPNITGYIFIFYCFYKMVIKTIFRIVEREKRRQDILIKYKEPLGDSFLKQKILERYGLITEKLRKFPYINDIISWL